MAAVSAKPIAFIATASHTPVVAAEMMAYNPDKTWTRADTEPEPAQ
jgi:hypothetical protein